MYPFRPMVQCIVFDIFVYSNRDHSMVKVFESTRYRRRFGRSQSRFESLSWVNVVTQTNLPIHRFWARQTVRGGVHFSI